MLSKDIEMKMPLTLICVILLSLMMLTPMAVLAQWYEVWSPRVYSSYSNDFWVEVGIRAYWTGSGWINPTWPWNHGLNYDPVIPAWCYYDHIWGIDGNTLWHLGWGDVYHGLTGQWLETFWAYIELSPP